jgi:hypothetical protein
MQWQMNENPDFENPIRLADYFPFKVIKVYPPQKVTVKNGYKDQCPK